MWPGTTHPHSQIKLHLLRAYLDSSWPLDLLWHFPMDRRSRLSARSVTQADRVEAFTGVGAWVPYAKPYTQHEPRNSPRQSALRRSDRSEKTLKRKVADDLDDVLLEELDDSRRKGDDVFRNVKAKQSQAPSLKKGQKRAATAAASDASAAKIPKPKQADWGPWLPSNRKACWKELAKNLLPGREAKEAKKIKRGLAPLPFGVDSFEGSSKAVMDLVESPSKAPKVKKPKTKAAKATKATKGTRTEEKKEKEEKDEDEEHLHEENEGRNGRNGRNKTKGVQAETEKSESPRSEKDETDDERLASPAVENKLEKKEEDQEEVENEENEKTNEKEKEEKESNESQSWWAQLPDVPLGNVKALAALFHFLQVAFETKEVREDAVAGTKSRTCKTKWNQELTCAMRPRWNH